MTLQRPGPGEVHLWHWLADGRKGPRCVLGAYLGCDPDSLVMDRAPQGKPFLRGAELEFNLSHSAGCTVLAVSASPIGVDIERLAPLPDLDALAPVTLADAELAVLADCAAQDQERWFYRCWTRKEALLKAMGCGLRRDPRSVDTWETSAEWRLHEVDLLDGFCISVAVPCGPDPVRVATSPWRG